MNLPEFMKSTRGIPLNFRLKAFAEIIQRSILEEKNIKLRQVIFNFAKDGTVLDIEIKGAGL